MRDDGGPVLRLILAAAAVAACGGEPPPSGPALQITGETTKLRRGDPLPETSPFFDGTTVRLRAARGEVLGLIVWRRPDGAEVPVHLELDIPIRGFRVRHHHVRRRSTSMYGPSAGAGEWPDRLDDAGGAPVRADRAAYLELAVPADAAAGARRGALHVGDARFAVELTVEPIALPSLEATPRVWAYFDPLEIERAAPGLDPVAWAAGLRRFGVAASPDLGLDQWERWRGVLAGLPYVPVLLPDEPAAEAAAVRGWIERLAGTGQVGFAIPIDEPRRLWQKLAVRERAARARAAGAGPGRFLFAVTASPHYVFGDLIDVYLSPFAVRLDAPRLPERWTYNGTPPFAGAMILDTDGAAVRTWGWIGWRWRVPLWYVWDAAYWSDRHNHRRRTGVRGLAPPSDLERDPVTFDDGEDRGNLDGVLAYPDAGGAAPSLRLAALRRGLQDRALLELLEACAGRAAAEAIAAPMVPVALADAGRPGASRPGSWPTDEAAWEAARQRLLDALRACD